MRSFSARNEPNGSGLGGSILWYPKHQRSWSVRQKNLFSKWELGKIRATMVSTSHKIWWARTVELLPSFSVNTESAGNQKCSAAQEGKYKRSENSPPPPFLSRSARSHIYTLFAKKINTDRLTSLRVKCYVFNLSYKKRKGRLTDMLLVLLITGDVVSPRVLIRKKTVLLHREFDIESSSDLDNLVILDPIKVLCCILWLYFISFDEYWC